MRKLYKRTWAIDLPFGNTFVEEIEEIDDNIDLDEVYKTIHHNKHADCIYAAQIFEKECSVVDGEVLLGKEKNHSPTIYFGKEFTAEQALNYSECTHDMRSIVEGNNYKRLVRTMFGHWFPLFDREKAIDLEANKEEGPIVWKVVLFCNGITSNMAVIDKVNSDGTIDVWFRSTGYGGGMLVTSLMEHKNVPFSETEKFHHWSYIPTKTKENVTSDGVK